MRTKSAQVDAVLANPSHSARALVTVYSSAGVAGPTWGTENGSGTIDPVLSVSIEQDVDGPRTSRVTLQRQQGRYSLSPLNLIGNPLVASEAPIDVARRIVIEAELLPDGVTNVPAGLKLQVFDGFIDEWSAPNDDLELVCTDKSARLRDVFIQRERVYCACQGVNATKGAYAWTKDLPPLVVGDLVLPSKPNSHFYRVTEARSPQGTTEPSWPTGSGATVVSGGVTFTESGTQDETGTPIETLIAQLLADNGLSSYTTLNCPVSPAWNVKPYTQQRQPVWEALQTITDQLGWWLRFEWDGSKFELTLKEPARTSATVHKTLPITDEVACDKFAVDVWSIRNCVRVIYSDSATRDPNGDPLRKAVEVKDTTSIAKYGGFERWCELAESSSSAIDTSTEANRLANAVLADLKEPLAGLGVTFPPDPYLELGDRITMVADGLRYTADQTLAIASIRQTFSAEEATTAVELIGAPCAARKRHLEKENRMGGGTFAVTSEDLRPVVATPVIAGVGVQATRAGRKNTGQVEYELHASRSGGFAPSAATLLGEGTEGRALPGRTYYVKQVPFQWQGRRKIYGQPTPEMQVVAGYVEPAHLSGRAVIGGPRNGDFEDLLDRDSIEKPLAPPDHWRLTAGTFDVEGDAYVGTTTNYGRHVALRQTATQAVVLSDLFAIPLGARVAQLVANVRPQGTYSSGRDLQFHVDFYSDAAGANPVGGGVDVACAGNIAAANTWARYSTSVEVPDGAAYAAVYFFKAANSSAYGFDIGDVMLNVRPTVNDPPYTNATLQNSFTNYNPTDHNAAGYTLDSSGCVKLRGLVARASAALNTSIFTLPVGYRPSRWLIFSQIAGNSWVRINIKTDGTVQVEAAGSGTWYQFISLEGITFDPRA